MRKYVAEVLLWLFGLDLGIAFGAGIYEARVVVPQWQKHSAADVAQHRPHVLGLRDHGAPHAAHARESGRCLARPGTKAVLVARRACDHRHGAERDLLVLHSDDSPADGHRGVARSGGQGSPVAMEASELRSACSHSRGVVGSTKGVVVASQVSAGANPSRSRVRRSALSGVQEGQERRGWSLA
jgi:hypothetical protein